MNVSHRLLAGLALTLSLPAGADTLMRFEVAGKPSQEIAIAGGLVQMGMKEHSIIFDSRNRVMTTIDNGSKVYTRMDEAKMKQMAAMAGQMMKSMAGIMANMPPEQRKKMQAMMGGGDGAMPKIEFKDMGRSDKVNGRSCQVWRSQVNGEAQTELCLAPREALNIPAEDLATLKGLFEFSQSMAKSFGAMGSMQQDWQMMGDKVPLRVVELKDGKGVSHELKSVDTSKLPASRFEVPAGYTERKLEMPHMGG